MKNWFKTLWKGKKRDNRGLTLVELICTIAIFGVVCTAVGSVMVISARSYGRSSDEINLQQEAQLTANQIADLLIDATTEINYDQDTKVMTVKNGDAHYTVSLDEENGKLNYMESLADGTVNTGTLAENVTDFKMKAEDFTISGNARVFLSFCDQSGREYEAWYTITARNGDVTGSAILENTATITTIREVTLEPNETYDLNAQTSVYGTAEDKSVTWSDPQSGGAQDPATQIVNGVLKIGTNETAASFVLTVTTNAMDGVTPIDVKCVTIRVRRVNDISMNGWLVSGTEKLQGAVYRISPAAQGTNLARVYGVEYDDAAHYKNPYYMHFDYYMTVNGASVNVWEYIDSSSLQINGDSNSPTVSFKLAKNMPANGKLTVVATAKHPRGTYDGVQTNKSSLPYANVQKEWVLEGPTATNNPHTVLEGDLKRGSQQYHLGFKNPDCPDGNLGNLKQTYTGPNGEQGQLVTYWRYREVGSDHWTNWDYFSDQGSDFHFQPASTLNLLKPDRDYEIEVESKLMKGAYEPYNGVQYWPTASTPLEYYHSSFLLKKAYFSLSNADYGMDNVLGAGTYSNPIEIVRGWPQYGELRCAFSALVAADAGYLNERMEAEIQFVSSSNNANANVQIGVDMYETKKGLYFNFMNAEYGLYKVTIKWRDGSYRPYADESNGMGIFYIKVNP